jgi:hypothetical protein
VGKGHSPCRFVLRRLLCLRPCPPVTLARCCSLETILPKRTLPRPVDRIADITWWSYQRVLIQGNKGSANDRLQRWPDVSRYHGARKSLGQGRGLYDAFGVLLRGSRPPLLAKALGIFHGVASSPLGNLTVLSGGIRCEPAYHALTDVAAFSDVIRIATRIVRFRCIVRTTPR